MKKLLSLVLVMALLVSAVAVLSSCGNCEHEWTYSKDGSVYHKMTCSICGLKKKEAHKWLTSGEENEKGMIVNTCKYCNYVAESYPFEEEEEEVTHYMWLADNSNGELLDGSRAFIAGESDESKYSDQGLILTDTNLLDKVAARNSSAKTTTRTNVSYVYGTKFAWGKQMTEINLKIQSGASDTPDMFVGFVYDMVGVQLNKNLRNLNDSKYFAFNNKDYNPDEDEQGYFWEYMENLSFSTKGKFLISSNYMVDTVRSYFVTPVSIKLLKDTGLTTDSFIELVNTNKYTWSLIADMTKGNTEKGLKAVAKSGKNGYEFQSSNTNAVWGFALASNCKLAIAGITYATNFNIIDRELDSQTADYKYTVDTNPTNYSELAATLKATMGSTAGMVLSYSKDNGTTYDGLDSTTDITGIRKAFSEQRLLVGGVIVLGAIEDSEYRSMWDETNGKYGYIVTPMPLYEENEQYRTVIHNLAKVIGIQRGLSEQDFNRCAAYINYCSTKSEDILNDYFNWSLAMGTAGAFAENVNLIKKMRNRLVYSVSKIADDAISLVIASGTLSGEAIQWKNYTYHTILLKNYTDTGINTLYEQVTTAKQTAVNQLQQKFADACD